MLRYFGVLLIAELAAAAVSAQVVIEIGTAIVVPGGAGSFDVSIRTSHDDVGGTGNGISWGGPFSVDECIANPEIQREASAFALLPAGCEETADCDSLRSLILSFGIPEFPPPLEDGDLLYTCFVSADPNAAPGDYGLSCEGEESATRLAVSLDTTCTDGTVIVRDATPTPTPTDTPLPATPTRPPPSATQDVATATATPLPCAGDCNESRTVTIEELVLAVRIALGQSGIASCPAVNPNGDLQVAIEELVRAVRAALDGCP